MSEFTDWVYDNRDKLYSLVIAIIYIIIAGSIGADRYSLKASDRWSQFTAVILIPSLACIWFGEGMGKYQGLVRLQPITKETPGWIMKLFGWILILSPIPYAIFLIFGVSK